MSFTSSVIASGAHGHSFCSDFMIFHLTKSLCGQMEMIKVVQADPKKAKERTSHVFQVEKQALIYTTSLWMCNRDPRRKDLSVVSVLESAIHFSRKGLTWSRLLEIENYNACGESPSQHPGCANVMTNIPRMLRKQVLYRDEPTSRAKKRAM